MLCSYKLIITNTLDKKNVCEETSGVFQILKYLCKGKVEARVIFIVLRSQEEHYLISCSNNLHSMAFTSFRQAPPTIKAKCCLSSAAPVSGQQQSDKATLWSVSLG